jgi:hypothetical protein
LKIKIWHIKNKILNQTFHSSEDRCEEIKRRHCYVSLDFDENIRHFDPFIEMGEARRRDDERKILLQKYPSGTFHSDNLSKIGDDLICHKRKIPIYSLPPHKQNEICPPLDEYTELPLKRVVYQLDIAIEEIEEPTEEEKKKKEEKRKERGDEG